MEASIYYSVLKREWSIRVLLWWDKWYKIRQFCYWRPLLITYLRFSWLSTQWESFSFPDSIFIGSLVSNMSLDIFSDSLLQSVVAFYTLRGPWKFKGKLSLDRMLIVAVLLFLLYTIINMSFDDYNWFPGVRECTCVVLFLMSGGCGNKWVVWCKTICSLKVMILGWSWYIVQIRKVWYRWQHQWQNLMEG